MAVPKSFNETPWTIRRAVVDDEPEVIRLIDELFAFLESSAKKDGLPPLRFNSSAALDFVRTTRLLEPGGFIGRPPRYGAWVAEGELGLAGLLIGQTQSQLLTQPSLTFFLPAAITDAAYRQRGVMTALADVMDSELRKAGIEICEFQILKGNQQSRTFWERRGYQATFIRYRSQIR